jgi:hypothetical protein
MQNRTLTEGHTFNELMMDIVSLLAGLELTNEEGEALIEQIRIRMRVPFSHQAVLDGHWEFYHDDDCGAVLDPVTKRCSACGWVPDMQSMGARRVKR